MIIWGVGLIISQKLGAMDAMTAPMVISEVRNRSFLFIDHDNICISNAQYCELGARGNLWGEIFEL